MATDLYSVLGVTRQATAVQIKHAYHRLAHRYHPDKNPLNAAAETRFKEISQAYAVLSNPQQRARYDQLGSFMGQAFDVQHWLQQLEAVWHEVSSAWSGTAPAPHNNTANAPRVVSLQIDFCSSVQGCRRQVQATCSLTCDACGGCGGDRRHHVQACRACAGSGVLRLRQGLFKVKKTCHMCQGHGEIFSVTCASCRGLGSQQKVLQRDVAIPAGAYDGMLLPGGSLPLDVLLEVLPHPLFWRVGSHLHMPLVLSLSEAALGTTLPIDLPHGQLRLKVPPGTQHGMLLRLRGKGLATQPGVPHAAHGDLLMHVQVEIPQQLGSQQQALLQQLEAASAAEHYPQRQANRQHFTWAAPNAFLITD